MFRWLCRVLCVLTLSLAFPADAFAEAVKGVVVYDKGCGSRLIIETRSGYVLAEWYGGNVPNNGDVLVGELNNYGFKDIYNITGDRATKLYIDDYMLSKQRVVDRLRQKCPNRM